MVSSNNNIPRAIWVAVFQRTESLLQSPNLQIWWLSLDLPRMMQWILDTLKRVA
ncbi:hypothetical protein YC2023_060548 [Brassica napus]